MPSVLSERGAANGKATMDRTRRVLALSPASLPPPESSGDIFALVRTLQAEIRLLNAKLDLVRDRAETSELAATAALQAVADLPKRMGAVLSAALRQQHSAISKDLGAMREHIEAELGQLNDRPRAPSDAQLQAAIVEHFDFRLEWLVNELSHRLVVLGNEVVRINKQLSASGLEGEAKEAALNTDHRPRQAST